MNYLCGKHHLANYDGFEVSKPIRDSLRRVLLGMFRRCYVPSTIGFHRWGGRGIRLSPEWYDEEGHWLKYKNFFLWAVKSGYKPGLQIDRIDNNGDYTPSNCRWVTSSQNNRNKSNNRLITYRGETLCETEMAKKYGMTCFQLHHRLRRGWSPEKALLTPMAPSEKLLTLNGVTMSQSEWGRKLGISGDTIKDRLSTGWSVEKALTTPLGLGGRSRLIEYNGEKHTIKEWAKKTPLKYRTFLHRLATGWSMEEIMTTPIKNRHDKRVRRMKK